MQGLSLHRVDIEGRGGYDDQERFIGDGRFPARPEFSITPTGEPPVGNDQGGHDGQNGDQDLHTHEMGY